MSSYFDHDASFANDSTNDNGFEDSDPGFLPETTGAMQSAFDTSAESFSQFDAATTPAAQTEAATPNADEPTFGGYYNADGTYHYTSDDTDRDPETGAIVRRW